MKKLLITEEEKSRILGMHNKAAGKQYLTEQATPAINDAKAALAYFTNLYKTNKYAEGQTFLGRNTFWQVKTPMGQNALRGGDASEIVVRGITSRGGRIWFDVSNDDESLIYGFGRTIQNEPLKLFCNVNCEQWDNSTQSIKPIKAGGTLGGNANLVGGEQNFVKMVMGLPDKSKIGRIPTEMLQKNPNVINNLSPELKQLYQTTTTPTQTKGLNESDIIRIVRKVIKESNRGYLMEDLSKIEPIKQKVNMAVQEMNKLITDTAKADYPKSYPTIKVIPTKGNYNVKDLNGKPTTTPIDIYNFELQGGGSTIKVVNAPTSIEFNRVTDTTLYDSFITGWQGSLSNQNWINQINKNITYQLLEISNKYLNECKKMLGAAKPATTTPAKQPVSKS